jgi:hypothetical protein
MVLKKMRRAFDNPKKLVYYFMGLRVARIIPDRTLLKIKYKAAIGRKLDLENPKSFNEKLQWLKLNDRKPEYCKMVDKYEVRKFVAATIGEEYLVPLLGVYDSYAEIDFAGLPNRFVLKPNHTSGDVFLCTDKSAIDYGELEKMVKKWLKKNYYWLHREWPYKYVKPKIICEQFISANDASPDDYKVLCFNGSAKLIQVHSDRFHNHRQDIYDLNWNRIDMAWGFETSDYLAPADKKPEQLEKMLALSERLAQHTYQVRIDWYHVDGNLYFGEMTFFDGAGFTAFANEADDDLLGSWINLNLKQQEPK